MKVLVTGGAGFIGRWLVKRLLEENHEVWVIDNLDNGKKENIEEIRNNLLFKGLIVEDIRNKDAIDKFFEETKPGVCFHLAAQINVQESIDNPDKAYSVNVQGTYNILQAALKTKTKIVLMGTCMVYDTVQNLAIDENHKLKPASPYAASKIAAEVLAESFYHSYKLPVVIVRPFNVYGPFQKSNMEGGVISIFLKNEIKGIDLQIYGDGNQTRDFLYVEDCANFLVKAGFSDKAEGEIINAGCGKDISINELAKSITSEEKIVHVPHHHPQAEILKLQCNSTKAKTLLDWEPNHSLIEGLNKTKEWLKTND